MAVFSNDDFVINKILLQFKIDTGALPEKG